MNLNASADRYPDQNLNDKVGRQDNQLNTHEEECQDDELFLRATLLENHQLGTELLYNRYYQVLCNHAARYVGSREVAEDIVSDIFYRFYSQRIFERITTSYRAYLFRSVRNYGFNHLRWEAARKVSMEDKYDILDVEGQQPDHITQYEELYQDLEKIIGDLPVQRRNIYIQYHFEGKSHKEIAQKLGISPRTVEAQIYRARQTVRSLMKNKWFISVLLVLMLV
jgi:RNA polymerase sigma-70 factor (family 1)